MNTLQYQPIAVDAAGIKLPGTLVVPDDAYGLVIFAHGSGSSRFSSRNNFVAQHLQRQGLATFLFDLLTREEDQVYNLRFDIDLLSKRLAGVTQYLKKLPEIKMLTIGYFGASTGSASALVAAADPRNKIKAVVSRGGRPDLAGNRLYEVDTPTLLLVGGLDDQVIKLNRNSLEKLAGEKSLVIIEGATHLFEEPGALEQVAIRSSNWFLQYLKEGEKELNVGRTMF